MYAYRDWSGVVELLLQLDNKQQIMQNNVDTQHKHMYSLVVCVILALSMARFTRNVTSQNLNAMKCSTELCLL